MAHYHRRTHLPAYYFINERSPACHDPAPLLDVTHGNFATFASTGIREYSVLFFAYRAIFC